MARLDNIKRKSFSPKDFLDYPIWVWDDANEALNPITERDFAPEEYGPLFISARFTTADNFNLRGYLVGNHAFGIFLDTDEIVLNFNLPKMAADAVRKSFWKKVGTPVSFFRLGSNLTFALSTASQSRERFDHRILLNYWSNKMG